GILAAGNSELPAHVPSIHFHMKRPAASHRLETSLEGVHARRRCFHRVFQPLPAVNRSDVISSSIVGRRKQLDWRAPIEAALAMAVVVEGNSLAAIVKILGLNRRGDIERRSLEGFLLG